MADWEQPEVGNRRYYCHQCSIEVRPIGTDLTCPRCEGGFVEEITPTETTSVSGQVGNNELPDGAFGGRVPQMFQFRFGRRPNGSAFEIIDFGAPRPPGPNQGTGIPQHPLNALLGQILRNFGSPMMVHGNPGDYVWGPGGLDAIITQLLNSVEGSGPPPADKETIERLPTAKITAEQVDNKMECSVCFDDFTLDEEVKVLPCRHHYHKDCILPWLEQHGTCPVCRKDLQGDDTTTQEFDQNISETLSSLNVPESMDAETTSSPSTRSRSPHVDRNPSRNDRRDFVEDDLE